MILKWFLIGRAFLPKFHFCLLICSWFSLWNSCAYFQELSLLHDHELPHCQLVAWGFYRPYCQLVAGRFSMVAMCLYHIIQGVIALSCNWQGVTLSNGKVLLSTLSNGKVLLSQILHYFFYKIVFRVMKIVKSMQK